VLVRLERLLGRAVSLDEAIAAFEAGDELVVGVVLDAGERLGIALAGLVGALHVRRIILAGAMAGFGERWLAAVQDAAASRSLAALAEDTTFELGPIDDIIVLGASALLMMRELGLSLRPRRQRRPASSDAAIDEPVAPVRAHVGAGHLAVATEGGGVPS
jgi:predicted NBD/HSP70 family sugar kinase